MEICKLAVFSLTIFPKLCFFRKRSGGEGGVRKNYRGRFITLKSLIGEKMENAKEAEKAGLALNEEKCQTLTIGYSLNEHLCNSRSLW
jgi:hypothetical protein